jgi:hypothetical protein
MIVVRDSITQGSLISAPRVSVDLAFHATVGTDALDLRSRVLEILPMRGDLGSRKTRRLVRKLL